jgi:glycosyltransferase involved in cell wall biosynthesis
MATARPILASHVPGIRDLLERFDGGPVTLVSAPSPAAFADALTALNERLVEATASALDLRAECERRYSNLQMFSRYQAFLAQLAR